jgi:hypothetical protein
MEGEKQHDVSVKSQEEKLMGEAFRLVGCLQFSFKGPDLITPIFSNSLYNLRLNLYAPPC